MKKHTERLIMKQEAEILRLDIVFLGDFNPKIFSPIWFSSYDLIGKTEATEANVEVIHKDVSVFNLDWFRLQVTLDRFSIFTEQEAYFEKLLDLVHHTFTHLSHTPIHAIGMNWGGHYLPDTTEEWHEFGYFIAPQSPWKNIFDDSAVLKVEMTEKNKPKDLSDGNIQVWVEPSKQIRGGIFINMNDHYEIVGERIIGCSDIIAILDSNREKSKAKFENVVKSLFENFNERKK